MLSPKGWAGYEQKYDMSDVPLYQVPMTLKRSKQWATKCPTRDKEIRMGPGSKAAMLRLIGAVGPLCSECRHKAESTT